MMGPGCWFMKTYVELTQGERRKLSRKIPENVRE